MDDDGLIPLHPDYIKVLRIAALRRTLILLVAATLIEIFASFPLGIAIVPALLLAGWWIFLAPGRRYRVAGYRVDGEWLRVVQGLWRRTDTLVPFIRVQHIDVDQGVAERRYGLATLVLHTAGVVDSVVGLPGLPHADALAIRDAIRARIGREHA
ncbi:PH domain-containing protein [Altererythrobacter xixiisoli]|uniref:PH domain-containing protein n=1 Tax=Croceibacterium xixiisoli TaxID=1476466 RepID=A0A6I4U0A5_9SPHN|nr:PH domain-containing protein [Croceibacterium xixiisoli]MXP00084.1 PH domain-containing protein [Croceibacterium xixiisoli]